MKIRSVRIRNFRGFEDDTIEFVNHTCLLGPNGSGKSTVLTALNIFFQELSNATDVASLSAEDFHNGNTDAPVEITVTFRDLSEMAQKELNHYTRHNELIATAQAKFDPTSGKAPVERFGERLVFDRFTSFFEAEKNRENVGSLREIFWKATKGLDGFPDVGSKPTKAAMIETLRAYEEAHPELCIPIRSTDLFYGPTRGKHKLEPFIQWVYLPAVKEASEEAEEAGNTALGKLLQRTVRKKLNFDEALNLLRQKAREQYDLLLQNEQAVLEEISQRLARRLASYTHSDASLEIVWLQGSDKSVSISEPKATVRAQEGSFKGSLLRFGHGLQRSFLLAILQELALLQNESNEGAPDAEATLIFACEEPELYQHPPQARHLANVLRSLSANTNQVLLTTHSPYFVSGEAFEEIRLIRKSGASSKCSVHHTTFERFSKRIAELTGKAPEKPAVTQAKLYAALQPERSEVFFCNHVVLVEGLEDRAYLTSALLLDNKWEEVRRVGLHIVPADGKSGILQLLVICQELGIPSYVVFDADGDVTNEQHRAEHERDNKRLLNALSIDAAPFPTKTLLGDTYAVWPDRLEAQIINDVGKEAWVGLNNNARKAFDPGVRLAKNPVFIAETLRLAWAKDQKPASLTRLTERLCAFASK